MAITVGDVLDNMDLYCGILEVRAINDARDDYEIVSACKYLDVEVKSIRTYEGLEPKTIVTIFLKKSEILNNYRESFKNIFDDEYSDTEEEPLEKVRRELEINETWDEYYKEKNNKKTLSFKDVGFENCTVDYLKYLLSGEYISFSELKIYNNFFNYISNECGLNTITLGDINWEIVYQKQDEAFLVLEEKIVVSFESSSIFTNGAKLPQKKYIELGKDYISGALGKDLKELFEEPNNIYKVELRLASSYDKLKAD